MKTRKELRRQKRRDALKGCGRYKYQNICGAELLLQRPLADGKKLIPINGYFVGDNWYRKMCPSTLRLVEIIEEVPLELPTPETEKSEILDLGEKVKIEPESKVVVEVKVADEPKREPLTKEYLEKLRNEDGLSWSKIAKLTKYSLTYVRKKCKQLQID